MRIGSGNIVENDADDAFRKNKNALLSNQYSLHYENIN